MVVDEIKKFSGDLAMEYAEGLNGFQFCTTEMKFFFCLNIRLLLWMINFKTAAPID